MSFRFEQRDIHSILERDVKKANFFFLPIDSALEWTTEYSGMKKQIERRPSSRIEEENDD
jgi:5-bromo-4-chloroindolyl phosphate hydrolysis protein